MKYHVVLNGCFEECQRQAGELNGFAAAYLKNLEQGNTVIICDGKQDGDGKKRLTEMVPAKSVLFIVGEFYDPEQCLKVLEENADPRDLYLFGSGFAGPELAVRLAKRMKGSSLTECIGWKEENGKFYGEKMVYSNHMKGTFLLKNTPCCLSVAKGGPEEKGQPCRTESVREIRMEPAKEDPRREFKKAKEKTGLEDAPFVVVAGRGAKKKETVGKMEELAKEMGAAFGTSRPVTMNAWAPMEQMVGVSGSMIKPEICIAAGVSGAPALYAGIEKSKFIVAVNSDENASIMKKADVAVTGDCEAFLEALAKQIRKGG